MKAGVYTVNVLQHCIDSLLSQMHT